MSADGVGRSRGIPFSLQENDFSPLPGEQKKVRQEEIQKISHIARHNLQTPSSETKIHDKRLLSHLSDFNDLMTSAENGKVEAQFSLAMMYFEGMIVDRNFEEGEKWLHKAAENGHRGAKRELHGMYFQGDGIVEW